MITSTADTRCPKADSPTTETRSPAKTARYTGQFFSDNVDQHKTILPVSGSDRSEFSHGRLLAQSEIVDLKFHDAGGLGKIYRAVELPLNREIAVKVIYHSSASDAENRVAFLREAEIIGRLDHPGVVSIYTVGETLDGRCFYTMPFLSGGSLEQSIDHYHATSPDSIRADSCEFRKLIGHLISVCKTIAYAHSRGIAHRDLKPKNVMLGSYGETVVIDWGLAGRFDGVDKFQQPGVETLKLNCDQMEDSSSNRGFTLLYASPEQLSGESELGPESDVYSLGVMLYRILTGTTPFAGLPGGKARRLAIRGQFAPPRSVKNGISQQLQNICLKAMATHPEDRHATAMELAKELECCLCQEMNCGGKLIGRLATLVRPRTILKKLAACFKAIAAC